MEFGDANQRYLQTLEMVAMCQKIRGGQHFVTHSDQPTCYQQPQLLQSPLNPLYSPFWCSVQTATSRLHHVCSTCLNALSCCQATGWLVICAGKQLNFAPNKVVCVRAPDFYFTVKRDKDFFTNSSDVKKRVKTRLALQNSCLHQSDQKKKIYSALCHNPGWACVTTLFPWILSACCSTAELNLRFS